MVSLDEVAASLKNPEELPLKPLSDDEVMAMIKSRLRSADMVTMRRPIAVTTCQHCAITMNSFKVNAKRHFNPPRHH